MGKLINLLMIAPAFICAWNLIYDENGHPDYEKMNEQYLDCVWECIHGSESQQ